MSFNRIGIKEYELLLNHPYQYFTSFFEDSHHNNYSGLFESSQSYWNDVKGNFMFKILSVFNLFSFKNYHINTLIFNYLVFFGPVALFRMISKKFPEHYFKLMGLIFLLPSALFFTSTIHRDGFVLLSICGILFLLSSMMDKRKYNASSVLLIVTYFLSIFLLRNYVLIAFIPAVLAWVISNYQPKANVWKVFAAVYTTGIVLFFATSFFFKSHSLPQSVVNKQAAFIEVSKLGESSIPITILQPNFLGFLKNAPEALNHSMMRPYFSEITSFIYLPFFIENLMCVLLAILCICFRIRSRSIPSILFLLFIFSLSNFLIVGYTVPIIGAIVRYKSIYLIFILIPIIVLTDWKRISNLLRIKNNKIYYFLLKNLKN